MVGALAASGALCLSGCFLPVPYTEAASPALVGVYRRSDGAPAAGREVAVSTAFRDSTCSRARIRGATDSAGRFAFPATSVRRRGIWLFPAFERFGLGYRFCAATADGKLQLSYDGTWSLRPSAAPDTLACFEGRLPEETLVLCRGRSARHPARAPASKSP